MMGLNTMKGQAIAEHPLARIGVDPSKRSDSRAFVTSASPPKTYSNTSQAG